MSRRRYASSLWGHAKGYIKGNTSL